MTTTPPGNEGSFLHELEAEVKEELTMAESQPLQNGDGVPTAEWLADPYAERYEVGLHTMLGAIEALEAGSGNGQTAHGAGDAAG